MMRWIRFVTITLLLGTTSAACLADAQPTWIAPAAAKQAIAAGGDLVVLDARSVKDYAAGHIEGAYSAPWQSFSDMSGKAGDERWGTLLPADKLTTAIRALGISGSTRVLVYSGSPKGWGEDGRIAWTLRLAGLKNVSIIDGGFEGWIGAGGTTSTAMSKPAAAGTFTVTALDNSLNVSKADVKAALGRAKLIDTRAPDEFAGARKFGEARGGHLPGTINLPWDKVFDASGRMRDPASLKQVLAGTGITPNDEIIAYCTKGIRSAHLVLVLREMGYAKAKNYDASFYEWAGDPSLPLTE